MRLQPELFEPGSIISPSEPRSLSVKERLILQKKDLEQRLADVDKLIVALDENPNLLRILELLGKVGL